MITVSGQLIDQLRPMKDLISSLLKNVSGLVMNCSENKEPALTGEESKRLNQIAQLMSPELVSGSHGF